MKSSERVLSGKRSVQILIGLICSGIMAGSSALAEPGQCRSLRDARPEETMGICGNRTLPLDKVRNLRSHHLECGSGVDHYIRTFVPFNYKKWKMIEKNGSNNPKTRVAMQNFRLEEPKIQWSGSIPYETTEVWDWTECYYGADPVCGYDRVCHDEQHCTTDANGKEHCETVEVCVDVMRSCYHDEERSEARYCSTERLNFQAEFNKPDASWNPNAKGYYDVIPNKYDLLPGEVEDVQVFANSGRSTSVSPSVDIGDPWNKYDFRNVVIQETGSRSASCQQGKTWNAQIKIGTVERIFGKKTPNAFRIPVNSKGEENIEDYLLWSATTKSKKSKKDNDPNSASIRTRPDKLKLMDVSYTMIDAMARQSRKFDFEREQAKADVGKGGTQKPQDYVAEKNKAVVTNESSTKESEEDGGFFKNTMVRVRLRELTGPLSRDIWPTENMFTNGSESSMEGMYNILLDEGGSRTIYYAKGPGPNAIWNIGGFELKKKQKYKLLVSMYQDGVPFYKQSSDKESSSAYSKELEIPFKTDNIDKRSGYQKFLNW